MVRVTIKNSFASFVKGETYEVSEKMAKRYIESGRATDASLMARAMRPKQKKSSLQKPQPKTTADDE